MLIAARIPAGLYAEIRSLLDADQYDSLDQFIEVALFNQIALERQDTPTASPKQARPRNGRGGAIATSSPWPGTGHRPAARSNASLGDRATSGDRNTDATKLSLANGGAVCADSPALLGAQVLKNFRLIDERAIGPATCGTIPRPTDERMYGLVNRLFPIKLIVRWLDVRAARTHRWPSLEETLEELGADVAALGTCLAQTDQENGRKRDQQLATSLPRHENPASCDRFLTHFVARKTRAGDVHPGAVIQYAYAVIRNEHILLTENGRALAVHQNPVLDIDFTSACESLSEEEQRSFVHQIATYLPVEASDTELVVKAVREGRTTPDGLVQATRPRWPHDWSEAALRSHVSGLIGRLTDAGVLTRTWKGRNAFYDLGNIAGSFLHELKLAAKDQTEP